MTKMNGRRGLAAALIISIAVNLFFIGGIAFRFYLMHSSNDAETNAGRPLPPNISWLVRDLAPERQEEMRAKLKERGMEGRASRIRMFKAQRESNRLMTADPFDAEALAAAFTALRDAANEYQRLSHLQTAEILSELSVDERRKVVEFINRRGPRDGRPPMGSEVTRRPFGGPEVRGPQVRGPEVRGPQGFDSDRRRPRTESPEEPQPLTQRPQ
ncbi:periplasmic heavy metal sensor [Gammaproteobacteria bacterium]|nr:periplasmic heavy metal sensor [Gammaproteobacteria bacterium]